MQFHQRRPCGWAAGEDEVRVEAGFRIIQEESAWRTHDGAPGRVVPDPGPGQGLLDRPHGQDVSGGGLPVQDGRPAGHEDPRVGHRRTDS
ncbi:hypothetical protein ACFFX0_04265 [Citricoccus parietis]|uniref:Uncharacterized protein n=1 Tax=Citricoccus parietis TaxID=592307 RepID=A0ABV5FUT2_9MICC